MSSTAMEVAHPVSEPNHVNGRLCGWSLEREMSTGGTTGYSAWDGESPKPFSRSTLYIAR